MNYQNIPNRWLPLYVIPQNTLVGNILYCLNLVNRIHALAFLKKKKTLKLNLVENDKTGQKKQSEKRLMKVQLRDTHSS